MEGESSVAKSQPDSLFFTKLPRELRDLIYSLAYIDADSEDRDYRIIGIPEWIKKERQKRRFAWAQNGPSPSPIPTCPLHDQLVSRQFYEEASLAFFRRARVFPEPDIGEFAKLCMPPTAVLRRTLVHFTCHWEDKPWKQRKQPPPFAALRGCTGLRTLRVYVVDDLFDVFREKLVFVHDLTSAGRGEGIDGVDFANIYGIDDLVKLTAVPELQLLPEDMSLELTLTPGEMELWHTNVEALKHWVFARRDEIRKREEAAAARAARWFNAGVKLRSWGILGPVILVGGPIWRWYRHGAKTPSTKGSTTEKDPKGKKPDRRRKSKDTGGISSFIRLTSSAASSFSSRRNAKALLTVRLPRFYQRHPTLVMVTALLCVATVMNTAFCVWLLVLLTAQKRTPTCNCSG